MTKGKYPTIPHIIEVTEFKTKERAKAALDVLKWLEKGGDKLDALDGKFKLNMETYLNLNESENNLCGTSCCIAGAMYACESGNSRSKYVSPFNRYIGIDAYFNAPKPVWNENSSELSKLFWNYPADEFHNTKLAAKVLKRYLEEGFTDWSVDV